MQKAMKQDPENPVIWENLSTIFRQLKQFDSAGFYFKKQLSKRSVINTQVWFAIGNFLDDIKMYDSAIVYFRKIIESDKDFIPAYTMSGSAFMKM